MHPGTHNGGRNIPRDLVDTSIREGDYMRADKVVITENAYTNQLNPNPSRHTVVTGLGMLEEKPGVNTEAISINESMNFNRLDETGF
jgi:hypothetical protein